MNNLENDLIKYLEQFLNNFTENYFYTTSTHNCIEIYANSKSNANDKFPMVRVCLNNTDCQIYIPNIVIPQDLKYNGIGKKLILIVFAIGQKYSYDTFVVQLVDGFKEKLLKRGALETDTFDTLQIVETTNLQ